MSYPFRLFTYYLFQTVHYSQQRKEVTHIDVIGFPVLELSQSDKANAGFIGSLFLGELVGQPILLKSSAQFRDDFRIGHC